MSSMTVDAKHGGMTAEYPDMSFSERVQLTNELNSLQWSGESVRFHFFLGFPFEMCWTMCWTMCSADSHKKRGKDELGDDPAQISAVVITAAADF